MATSFRGLCTSSVAPSTSQGDRTVSSQSLSSASRTDLRWNRSAGAPRSRKCRVVVAVLVDPKVQSALPPLGTTSTTFPNATAVIELGETQSGAQEPRVVQFADSPDFQTSRTPNVEDERSEGTKTMKKTPVLGLTDTNVKSTLEHRLLVAFGGTVVTGMLAKALSACHSGGDYWQLGAGTAAAYILADLGTGIYHWGIDNYGDASTPIFGTQIDAFQGHHQRPWTITKREFANNIHAIARPAGIFLAPFLLLPSQPFADSFLALFLGLVVLSQQIHAFSHMKKSQLPGWVVGLQDSGVLLGRKMHGTHHKPPYDVNYCIVSGLWNPLLNETEAFKKAERWIYGKWGIAPRAWSETSEEWLAMESYFEDGTELDSSQSS